MYQLKKYKEGTKMVEYIIYFLIFFVSWCFVLGGAYLIGEIGTKVYQKIRGYLIRRNCVLAYLRLRGYDMHILNRKNLKFLIKLAKEVEHND